MDSRAQLRILVVDDEASIRDLLSDFLTMNHYLCTTADSGPKAIACVAQGLFDLVLLDIKMPGMSGLETLRAIKERTPHQPVVMVTAVSEVESAVAALKLGALDYILKPFTLGGLLAKVGEAVAKGAAWREEQARNQRLSAETREHRDQSQQRTREIQGLNRLFQSHLEQRKETEERWRTVAKDLEQLHQQVQELKSKVEEGLQQAVGNPWDEDHDALPGKEAEDGESSPTTPRNPRD